MKRIFLAVWCCWSLTGYSQTFSDNFSDGDFSDVWTGSSTAFLVNGTLQLQLQGDCASGGEDYLSAAVSTSDTATWECRITLGFDPSGSNNARFYLQSDNPDLGASLNGYYVRVGEDGSNDALKLYRQNGTTSTLLLSGTTGAVAVAPDVRIRVVRTSGDEWRLFADYSGGTDFVLEGFVEDPSPASGMYMGVYCDYTSTRCDDFYFDDFFAGPLFTDEDPPVLTGGTVLNASQLRIQFGEAVTPASAESESNYSLSGGFGNPLNAQIDADNPSRVVLTFADEFPNGATLTLECSDISDLAGNIAGLQVFEFSYYAVQPLDVLITEIMADPEPVVGLPAEEYLELWNATTLPIDLSGYTIADATSFSGAFPAFVLDPGVYVIITDIDNEDLYTSYGDVIGVDGLPSLNNTGDSLQVWNAEMVLVHQVNYSDSWYRNAIKEDGGYSLEMIDTQNPCQGADNWIASDAAIGGTPGQVNSVAASNPDEVAPELSSVFPLDPNTLQVVFSEVVVAGSITLDGFTVNNGIGVPVSFTFDGERTVALQLATPLAPGVVYVLECSGISDCSGNGISLGSAMEFGIPEPPEANDIVINEILFNPVTGGYDFVELYNRSNKLIDLSGLRLVELDVADTTNVLEFCAVSNTPRLLLPGQFFILTENIEGIITQYSPPMGMLFSEDNDMPNFPDDEGIALLETLSFTPIDRLQYNSDWHYALLEDEDGVSLERLNYELPSQDADNWHSAAEAVGFATPGRINSVFSSFTGSAAIFELEYPVFTPDGDAFRDVLVLSYQMPGVGYTANIQMYDLAGRPVATVASNLLLAESGLLTWDGITDEGEAAPMGIYMIFAEVFNLNGNVERHKLKCTLARRE
ncbi:MAG TPA: hypothetical protein DHW15_08060 [Bacteroidetes bacterium]|jgi:hypothetical protein|nr:MAG: hypothetical protein ABR94_07410 [Sphingobacteriales bacterium BACL12 MAG-120802-bin5]KRP13428.1 MAG: hypothetical protein ABR95_02580 [Sphingobacteriales bacterium BACL12 MAG-120813-bin55]HCK22098.1 hypothetical protein [Bacteroidota bacterium]